MIDINAKFLLWTKRDRKYAGKITLSPDNEQEAAALRIFKLHAGIDQHGRKLDVVFRWKSDILKAKQVLTAHGIDSSEALGAFGGLHED